MVTTPFVIRSAAMATLTPGYPAAWYCNCSSEAALTRCAITMLVPVYCEKSGLGAFVDNTFVVKILYCWTLKCAESSSAALRLMTPPAATTQYKRINSTSQCLTPGTVETGNDVPVASLLRFRYANWRLPAPDVRAPLPLRGALLGELARIFGSQFSD